MESPLSSRLAGGVSLAGVLSCAGRGPLHIYCAIHAHSKKGRSLGVLVNTPFTKFTKAKGKGKDGVLSNHASNLYHQAKAFISTYEDPDSRIDSLVITKQKKKQSDENKHILSEIVETILLLGRQGMSLRGHRVKAEGLRCSLTKGANIVALVVLKNGLHPVKSLSVKLQRRDSDIYKAYGLIDFVIDEVQSMRTNVEEVWDGWYNEVA